MHPNTKPRYHTLAPAVTPIGWTSVTLTGSRGLTRPDRPGAWTAGRLRLALAEGEGVSGDAWLILRYRSNSDQAYVRHPSERLELSRKGVPRYQAIPSISQAKYPSSLFQLKLRENLPHQVANLLPKINDTKSPSKCRVTSFSLTIILSILFLFITFKLHLISWTANRIKAPQCMLALASQFGWQWIVNIATACVHQGRS